MTYNSWHPPTNWHQSFVIVTIDLPRRIKIRSCPVIFVILFTKTYFVLQHYCFIFYCTVSKKKIANFIVHIGTQMICAIGELSKYLWHANKNGHPYSTHQRFSTYMQETEQIYLHYSRNGAGMSDNCPKIKSWENVGQSIVCKNRFKKAFMHLIPAKTAVLYQWGHILFTFQCSPWHFSSVLCSFALQLVALVASRSAMFTSMGILISAFPACPLTETCLPCAHHIAWYEIGSLLQRKVNRSCTNYVPITIGQQLEQST